MEHFDVCIAGAGIVGLSLALELGSRGLTVVVLERGTAMSEASWAAAGMLAAHDPDNPAALVPLAELSISMYPEFLERVRSLSGSRIPIRTRQTLQKSTSFSHVSGPLFRRSQAPSGARLILRGETLANLEPALADSSSVDLKSFQNAGTWHLLNESSLDPRDLCRALPAATESIGVEMREHHEWLSSKLAHQHESSGRMRIAASRGSFEASAVVDCRGAWASTNERTPIASENKLIRPVKGQALTLALPSGLTIARTIRSPEIYLVPRGHGRVLIGATVEEAGFDKSTDNESIYALIQRADALVPGIAQGTILDRWAGLRPATPDALPLLGAIAGCAPAGDGRRFIAAGHYRNGILLAPATALVMAQLICGDEPSIDLAPFSPSRFQAPELRK